MAKKDKVQIDDIFKKDIEKVITFLEQEVGRKKAIIVTSKNVAKDDIPMRKIAKVKKDISRKILTPKQEAKTNEKQLRKITNSDLSNFTVSDQIEIFKYEFKVAFNSLNPSINPELQVEEFFLNIYLMSNEEILKRAFILACNLEEISFNTICKELKAEFNDINENEMKTIFKKEAAAYFLINSNLNKKYKSLQFINLIRAFASVFYK